MAIRNAGYDAIVITGKARRPTYLSISDHSVDFKDARGLWGLGVDEVEGLLESVKVYQANAASCVLVCREKT